MGLQLTMETIFVGFCSCKVLQSFWSAKCEWHLGDLCKNLWKGLQKYQTPSRKILRFSKPRNIQSCCTSCPGMVILSPFRFRRWQSLMILVWPVALQLEKPVSNLKHCWLVHLVASSIFVYSLYLHSGFRCIYITCILIFASKSSKSSTASSFEGGATLRPTSWPEDP